MSMWWRMEGVGGEVQGRGLAIREQVVAFAVGE